MTLNDRWNETLAELVEKNLTEPESGTQDLSPADQLQSSMMYALSKYVFFAEDPEGLDLGDKIERYVLEHKAADLGALMPKVMQTCQSMLMYCKWQGKKRDCKNLFNVIRTDSGFCCAFNAVSQNELL